MIIIQTNYEEVAMKSDKVNIKDIRTTSLTYILHIVLVFLLLTLNKQMSAG